MDRPVRWAIWEVTQHDARAGLEAPGDRPAGLGDPARRFLPRGYRVMFGREDDPQFARAGDVFQFAYTHEIGKAALYLTAG